MIIRNAAVMVAGVLSVAVLAGCSTTAGAGTNGEATDKKLAKLVPEKYRQSGVIKGASSFTAPPLYYYAAGNKPSGMVVDMVELAAGKLGLKVQWAQMPYDGIIPALNSGRIDVSGSQFSATKANLKVASTVSPWMESDSVVVAADNPLGIEKVEDLCGRSIGYTAAAAPDHAVVTSLIKWCRSHGHPAPIRRALKDAHAATLAIQSGQVDTHLVGYTTARYSAEKSNLEVVLEGKFARRASGVVLAKDNAALAKALAAGFKEAMKDGSYQKVMKKWGDKGNALDQVFMNETGPAWADILEK
ncbi:transporter substrate-binding domain-containing protein [Streptomyces sp. NPDC005356]|uniref:transporter substrate-binding domain-containing protein n=1 Tax=Streptomyces sp. NPDC005356 TaxID=3157167 RepID=UPI0033ABF54D